MNTHIPNPLFAETLPPRLFNDLGLSRQRLLQWFEVTGVEPERKEGSSRRSFSPADVLRLAVLKELKGPAPIAFNEQAALIAFIREEAFPQQAVSLWAAAQTPTLVTDLAQMHALKAVAEIRPAMLMTSERQLHLYKLSPAVTQMLASMLRGGSAEQRTFAAEITTAHAQAIQQQQAKRAIDVGAPVHSEQEALAHVLLEEEPQQHLHVRRT